MHFLPEMPFAFTEVVLTPVEQTSNKGAHTENKINIKEKMLQTNQVETNLERKIIKNCNEIKFVFLKLEQQHLLYLEAFAQFHVSGCVN